MTKTTILNKGERTIQTAEGNLSPKGQAVFSVELAERLMDLYPNELSVVAEAVKAKEETEVDADDVEKLTMPQLKAELDESDPVIEYPSNANKAALVALVKAKREADVAVVE